MAVSAIALDEIKAAPRTRAADGARIRPCSVTDIPAVARLFQHAFRPQADAASQALEYYLRELFFDHPWQDRELTSKVFVSPSGAVEGFIGLLPLRLSWRGKQIKAAVASSLMVANPKENPLAGARLLRSFISGPQDLSLSETSNSVAQGMWQTLGGVAVPAYSMEWLRVLRPARFTVSAMGDWARPLKVLHPIGAAVDAVLDGVGRNPLRALPTPTMADDDIDPGDAALVAYILELAASYSLRPEWDEHSLGQFLGHAATKRRHGVLVRRVVLGRHNRPLGCFLYYQRSGGVGYVLQVLARPEARDLVIDRLFDHAFRTGCIAVRGRSTADLADTLLRRQAIFLHRSSLTAHSRDPELLNAIRSDDALITGLAGESWTRLIGDTFT
jgi:hypothetical protein